MKRLNAQTQQHLSDKQAGFRKNRSIKQQILALRNAAEKIKQDK